MQNRNCVFQTVLTAVAVSVVFVFCAYNSGAFRVLHSVSYDAWNNNNYEIPQEINDITSSPTSVDEDTGSVATCGCKRQFPGSPLTSTCSSSADLRGPNQTVVTYSLFGNPDSNPEVHRRYFANLRERAHKVAQVYPGWVMRVYHNFSSEDPRTLKYLCSLHCQFDHVDLCNVSAVDNPAVRKSSVGSLNPRMWRFLVMLDPLVDIFISRDIDSDIIPREVAAVHQWINSSYTFHVMRDHPSHGGYMLAGLWGAKPFQRRDLIRNLGFGLILAGQNEKYETDQNMLDMIVWPFATFDVMAHDSYFCNNWMFAAFHMSPFVPFPTQRDGRNYTGYDITRKDIADHIKMCPRECRPAEHKNWLFC